MAIIRVHGYHFSGRTAAVLACLQEKEVDYEFLSVDLLTGAQKEPQFLALNPFGKVPAIQDGDLILFESRAIVKFLAEKYREQGTDLMGSTLSKQAMVDQWCEVESQSFGPPCSVIVFQSLVLPMLGGKTDEAAVNHNLEKLSKVLDVYEDRLSKSKYLAGDFFSLADLQHLSSAHLLINGTGNGQLITSRKHVNSWWEEISSRPAWKSVAQKMKVDEVYRKL